MMKRIVLSILFLAFVLNLSSQSYVFDSIPENLRRRADAVIRSEQCLFTIIDDSHATEKVKTVVTLLNERANRYRFLRVHYDNDSKVSGLKGTIYDEKGEIIKVLGIMDIQDLSAVPGGSFYSDDRMKFLYFPIYQYPYTIEYEYVIDYSSLPGYPGWNFQDRTGISVERSGIQYVVPKDIKFRYYTENLKNNVDSVVNYDNRYYTWQEENIPAIAQQVDYQRVHYPWPQVYTAPMDFYYGGYKGSLSSWKTYGEWVYNLIKGLDALPQSELAKVTEITSRTTDVRERAKLIYEYMQSKTRYVSIKIGIGGARPTEASAVAQSGFGDCKGLVNYTKALLKAAGIKSYYTLVKSGSDGKILKEFVDDQFDHIILCVPMPKDTVWLECTDQTKPFNYLGTFTADRYVLLVTPDGGKLVRTPGFTQRDNITVSTGTVFINNLGKSTASISDYYSGKYYDAASGMFTMESEEEMKRYLNSALSYSDFAATKVSFTEDKSEKPSARFNYELAINDFATVMGSRMFFSPSLDKEKYLQDQPVVIEIPDVETSNDSISYFLPVGYKVVFRPADVFIEKEFGKFIYQLYVKNDMIIYKRYLQLNKGEIPIEKFYEFRSFVNTIAETDREKIILKN